MGDYVEKAGGISNRMIYETIILRYTRGKGVEIYEAQFGRKASGACGRVVGTEPAADTDADILWF